MAPVVEDIDFLSRSEHRVRVLEILAHGPTSRRDLRDAAEVSSPTISRILTGLEERHWIDRDGRNYELTLLGEFVAERFLDLCEVMEIEQKLRGVWQWLPQEMEGFSVELFADAVVSRPGSGYPYEPVERVAQLIKEASQIRGFGSLELKSATIETVCGVVLAGMEVEYVFTPDVMDTIMAWNPDRVREVVAQENCTLLVHDDLPDQGRCGLSIFDERATICCHDTETGALLAAIDTDAPEAREWALAVFERCRREASPIEPDSFDSRSSSKLLV